MYDYVNPASYEKFETLSPINQMYRVLATAFRVNFPSPLNYFLFFFTCIIFLHSQAALMLQQFIQTVEPIVKDRANLEEA